MTQTTCDALQPNQSEREAEDSAEAAFLELCQRSADAVASTNPERLYRFRNSSSSYFETEMTRLIENGEMYFPTRDQLNDPFDCVPKVKKHPSYEVYCRKIWPIQRKFMEAVVREAFLEDENVTKIDVDIAMSYIERPANQGRRTMYNSINADDFSTVGVLSLTTSSQNLSLWGIYAGNGLGICVEVTKCNVPSAFRTPTKLQYTSERPVFDHHGFIALQLVNRPHRAIHLTEKEIELALSGLDQLEANFKKYEKWSNEEEYRVVWFDGGGKYIRIEPMIVSRIIFGHKVPQAKIDFVKDLCLRVGGDVKLAIASPHHGKYEMVVRPLSKI